MGMTGRGGVCVVCGAGGAQLSSACAVLCSTLPRPFAFGERETNRGGLTRTTAVDTAGPHIDLQGCILLSPLIQPFAISCTWEESERGSSAELGMSSLYSEAAALLSSFLTQRISLKSPPPLLFLPLHAAASFPCEARGAGD